MCIIIFKKVVDTETYNKIDAELSTLGKTRKDMCRETGVSYNTLASLYQRKSENISLDVLRTIARYLNVSLDYLIFDDVQNKDFGKQNSPAPAKAETGKLAQDDLELLADYHRLNESGREAARNAVRGLTFAPNFQQLKERHSVEMADIADDAIRTIDKLTEMTRKNQNNSLRKK